MVLRDEAVFFAAVIAFALGISVLAYTMNPNDAYLAVRLLALNGYIALAVAALLSAFLREVAVYFKKSFISIHHYFAAVGLVLITLHPTLFAIQTINPAIFIPNTSSLYLFFVFGGTQALILIYIAVAAVLLRRKIVAYWRWFHALMYVALLFGVVHATLLGTDFSSPVFVAIYGGLFVAVLAAFVYKRWQFHQIKVRSKKRLLEAQKKKT